MTDRPIDRSVALVDRMAPYGSELDGRIIAAALDCIARWGLAKTTLDDIARAAGCSRATVYRTFPGGKDSLITEVGQRELARFFGALAVELAVIDSLEDALVVAVSEACRAIAGHAALQYLLEHEVEVVLPWVAFDGLEPLLTWASEFAAIHLARFVGSAAAPEIGEWVCRVVVSYGCDLDGPPSIDLAEPATAREFVRMFMLPGIYADGIDITSAPAPVTDLTLVDIRVHTCPPSPALAHLQE